MRAKEHCGECKYLKYVDGDGLGYCELLQECDVCVTDEACVNYVEDTSEEKEVNNG